MLEKREGKARGGEGEGEGEERGERREERREERGYTFFVFKASRLAATKALTFAALCWPASVPGILVSMINP